MLSRATAQRIEQRKLSDLTPYPRNPRRHSDAQIAQIAGSIAQFGFNAPILIDSRGNIIAGHGRYLASLKLGLETVPTIVLEHLSETEKRAYLLADSKLAELSSFDDDLLRAELAELRDAEIDLGALGFDDNELAVLLVGATGEGGEAGDEAEEEIPEAPAEPVTRPGDIWSVDRHELICGDSRDRDVVHRLFDGARANAVTTSPPGSGLLWNIPLRCKVSVLALRMRKRLGYPRFVLDRTRRISLRFPLAMAGGCLAATIAVLFSRFLFVNWDNPRLVNYAVACLPVVLTILIAFIPNLREARMR